MRIRKNVLMAHQFCLDPPAAISFPPQQFPRKKNSSARFTSLLFWISVYPFYWLYIVVYFSLFFFSFPFGRRFFLYWNSSTFIYLITSWHKPACVSFLRSAPVGIVFLVLTTLGLRVAVISLKWGRRKAPTKIKRSDEDDGRKKTDRIGDLPFRG